METDRLQESTKLLNDIIAMIQQYGDNLGKPGNREHFEIARQAAIDIVWSIHTLLRELHPAEAFSD